VDNPMPTAIFAYAVSSTATTVGWDSSFDVSLTSPISVRCSDVKVLDLRAQILIWQWSDVLAYEVCFSKRRHGHIRGVLSPDMNLSFA